MQGKKNYGEKLFLSFQLSERVPTDNFYRRSKSTEEHHGWKAEEYKHMPKGKSVTKKEDQEGEQQARPKFVSNHTHYSTTDRDARVSVKPGKPRQLNYSMQTAVDMSSHVITNVEAHFADRRDSECLAQVLLNTIDNLKEQQLQVEEIAADTGYSSGKALQACIDNNIIAYIPNFGHYKPIREGFVFDAESDRYTCQAKGVHLPYKKTLTRIKKAITKNNIVQVRKIVRIALYAQVVLAEELIIKSWKKRSPNHCMTRCTCGYKHLMQSG